MARTVIHKVEGKKSYARCKGKPGHRWDDHPNYTGKKMHEWALARMVFRCSECGMIKAYEQDSNNDWFLYYYERPKDYWDVKHEFGNFRNEWATEYYKAAFQNGKK